MTADPFDGSAFYVIQHIFRQFCDMFLYVSKIIAYFVD